LSAAKNGSAEDLEYELVEIPKALLEEAKGVSCKVSATSQRKPKPGSCTVIDEQGSVKFQLYFDGGSAQKLTVKGIRSDLCIRHASWKFKRPQLSPVV
jgi:type II restriction enzyme